MTIAPRIGHSKKPIYSIFCMLFILLFTACGGQKEKTDLLSYQSRSYRAVLRGELWGAPLEGELLHMPPSETTEGDVYRLTFTAPEALAGITYTVSPHGTTVSLGDISVPADDWTALTWRDLIGLFSLQGNPLTITASEHSSQMTVVYQTVEGEAVTLTLHSQTGTPTLIETDGIRIEILSFES